MQSRCEFNKWFSRATFSLVRLYVHRKKDRSLSEMNKKCNNKKKNNGSARIINECVRSGVANVVRAETITSFGSQVDILARRRTTILFQLNHLPFYTIATFTLTRLDCECGFFPLFVILCALCVPSCGTFVRTTEQKYHSIFIFIRSSAE